MLTFEEAVADTIKKIEEARALSIEVCRRKQIGAEDPALAEQLQRACIEWDNRAVQAVQLAPGLEGLRHARLLGPEGGLSQSAVPNYLLLRNRQ